MLETSESQRQTKPQDLRLSERQVPELSESLARLQDSADQLDPEGCKQRTLFSTLTKRALKKAQNLLTTDPSDWQNRTMIHSYLKGRASLAFYSHVYYLLEKDAAACEITTRSARLIYRSLAFRRMLAEGTLPPEHDSQGQRLDQTFYSHFFATVRLPGTHEDSYVNFPSSDHLLVICRGQFFVVHGLSLGASEAQWRSCLQDIMTRATSQSYSPGTWTALPRSEWAAVRSTLRSRASEAQAMDLMESSVLCIALEPDITPKDRTDTMRKLSIESPEHRWFDKSHQLIIFADGTAGIQRDHTLLDGHLTAFYAAYLYQFQESIPSPAQNPLTWESLNFTLPQQLVEHYQGACAYLAQLRSQFWMYSWDLPALDPQALRTLGLSPDFIVQLLIHCAAYELNGRFQSVSESVHMRHTRRGRYDSLLTLTSEMKTLVEELSVTQDSRSTSLPSLERFAAAAAAHRNLVKAGKRGFSPMLHITALLQHSESKITQQLEAGTIVWGSHLRLHDEGFRRSLFCEITTSDPGYVPGLELSGFTDTWAAVVGISYLVKPSCTSFFIKADGPVRKQAQGFPEHMQLSFERISKLWQSLEEETR